ncbi:hypothetical protein LguiA_022326 [Lonicera macranthoides]
MANINIARSVVNVVRTSLGPKGMVKMISSASGGIIITNDGATILKENGGPSIGPQNARLLSSPSHRTSSPNNTTTIDVIVDALLKQCQTLLHAGIHPIVVFNSLHKIYINYQGVMVFGNWVLSTMDLMMVFLGSCQLSITIFKVFKRKWGFCKFLRCGSIQRSIPRRFDLFKPIECGCSRHVKVPVLVVAGVEPPKVDKGKGYPVQCSGSRLSAGVTASTTAMENGDEE